MSGVQMQVDGPLRGIRVLEFAGVGPGPFCCMALADMGADVVRIERDRTAPSPHDFDRRGRRSILLDLKRPDSVATCVQLAAKADVLIEGFRPAVMERLGLGPDILIERNPQLVYGRITGWGQDGPYAAMTGHDMNYAAITGAIHAIGPEERPTPPLNLVGDYGGGAMILLAGVLAALLHVRSGGKGQVVDAAMSDGVAYLMTVPFLLKARGQWDDTRRRANLLDGGCPFYDVYRCADGGWITIAPLEPRSFALLVRLLALPDHFVDSQYDQASWASMRRAIAATVSGRTRAEWCAVFDGSDICFAPALTMTEAPHHPHNAARSAFIDVDGMDCPAPAPRFSGTPTSAPPISRTIETDAAAILASWGG